MIHRDEIPGVVRAARNLIADAEHHAIGALARDGFGTAVAWWDDDAECFCVSGAIRRALWEHAGCPYVTEDGWWLDVGEENWLAIDTDRILARIKYLLGLDQNLPTINDKRGHHAILAVLDRYLALVDGVKAGAA